MIRVLKIALYPSILILLLFSQASLAQTFTFGGQVVDQTSGEPLAYVSIGVVGKPIGTVSDDQGNFKLTVPDSVKEDSIRIGLIGYAPYTGVLGEFGRRINASGGRHGLRPAPVTIAEVTVRPTKFKRRVLGNSTNSNFIQAKFSINELGNQGGLAIHLRRPSFLEQVSFHIAQCTYDSLFFRVNIYQIVDGKPGPNLLPRPVYARVKKGQIKDRIVANIDQYNIMAQGDILVSLEMVKSLGPGLLTLSSRLGGGPIYYTSQNFAGWKSMGGFGLGIDATVLEESK